MKADYDFVMDSLSLIQQDVINSFKPNPLASLKEGPPVFEANRKLGDAAIEFIGECILNAPFVARPTIERLAHAIDNIKKAGQDYIASDAALTEFNKQFSIEILRESKAKTKQKAESGAQSQLESDAIIITRQSLFLSFFKMLQPKLRRRLIKMLEDQRLCDKEILEELQTRIDEKVEDDKLKVEALLHQVENGGMDCFLWLHGMLFNFFNKVMELEEKNAELNAQLDAEKKLRAEMQTGPPKPSVTPSAAPAKSERECELERENASLKKAQADTENRFALNLQAQQSKAEEEKTKLTSEIERQKFELSAKDEAFTLKMDAAQAKSGAGYEAKISALEARRKALEDERERYAEEVGRKAKVTAHAFEMFLDGLPRKYAVAGYVMLKSIVNEWDDVQSIQEKDLKYSSSCVGKSNAQDLSTGAKIAFCILAAIAVLGAGAAAYSHFGTRNAFPVQAATPGVATNLDRLAGMKLNTMEDLNAAYDKLKPSATIDEIRFLNARQRAIMSAENGELK